MPLRILSFPQLQEVHGDFKFVLQNFLLSEDILTPQLHLRMFSKHPLAIVFFLLPSSVLAFIGRSSSESALALWFFLIHAHDIALTTSIDITRQEHASALAFDTSLRACACHCN